MRGAGSNRFVWDGTDDAGRRVANGTYFVKMKAGSHVSRTRVTLIK